MDPLSAIAAVVGIGSGINSMLQGDKATSAAVSASQAQQGIAAQQLALMQDQWNTYKTTFLPVGQRIVDTAMNTPVKPDFATVERMAGEGVKQGADLGWQNFSRQAQDTRGAAWNPGSDNYQTALRNWNNQAAGQGAIAKQIAHTAEKNRVEDLNWNRMVQAYGLGQGIPGSAAALGGSAGSLYGSAANTAMNLAGMQGQNAAMGFYGAGRALSGWNRPAAAATGVPNYSAGTGYDPNSGLYLGGWNDTPAVPDQSAGGWGWRDGGRVRAIRMDDGGVVPDGFSVPPMRGDDQRMFALWFDGADGPTPARGAINMGRMMPAGGAMMMERGMADGGKIMAIMRHPTQQAMYFADGGQITGPGTGTSDSIPAKLPPGSYVVPADVVRAKGTDFFDKMHGVDVPAEFHTGALGNGVAADVSNGEYLVAPQVVKQKGQEFFDKLLERYHTPVKKKGADSLPESIEVAIRAHRPTAALRRH